MSRRTSKPSPTCKTLYASPAATQAGQPNRRPTAAQRRWSHKVKLKIGFAVIPVPLATHLRADARATPPVHDRTSRMEPLLLVEDKTELRAMLRKALERAGYEVDEAADGTAAGGKVG